MLRTTLIWIGSLSALATAQGNTQCTSGEIVCCDSVQSADVVTDLGLATGISNAVAANLGFVGSKCTTFTVIGRGRSCATKQLPVCCTDNSYGSISLGCSYINPLSFV